MDCTPKVRQLVKVVYSERETTDHEPETPPTMSLKRRRP